MFAYATSQSTEVSCSCARAPVANRRTPVIINPIATAIAMDGCFIASPPGAAVKPHIELLRVLEPLQHEIRRRQAREAPRRRPNNCLEVRVSPHAGDDSPADRHDPRGPPPPARRS